MAPSLRRGRGGSRYGPLRGPGALVAYSPPLAPVPPRSREEVRDFEEERANEKYASDVSDYVAPQVGDEDSDNEDFDQTNWRRLRRSNFIDLLPDQNLEMSCKWYSKVLKESTFLPERLREVLSLDGLNMELQINAEQMLALNYIYSGLNESRTYFMSRNCMIAFFGDPYNGCPPFHPHHYWFVKRFLGDTLTNFDRETVFFVLLVNIYWKTMRTKTNGYLMDNYVAWKEKHVQIQNMVEPPSTSPLPDWDPYLLAEYGFTPYWPVFVALWWVSQNRELFVAGSQNPKLPPPPLIEDLKAPSDRMRPAQNYFLRLMGGHQRIYSDKLAKNNQRETMNVGEREFMHEACFCYEPYRNIGKLEYIDIPHLVKKEWFDTYPQYFYTLEEYISDYRLMEALKQRDSGVVVSPRNAVLNDNPVEMDNWAFSYLLYHPSSRWKLSLLPKDSRFRKAYMHQKREEDIADSYRRQRRSDYVRNIWERKNFADPVPSMLSFLAEAEKYDEYGEEIKVEASEKDTSLPPPDPNAASDQVKSDKSQPIQRVLMTTLPPLPSGATLEEKIKWFDQYAQVQERISAQATASNTSSSSSRIFSTGRELRLKSPETGKDWDDIDVMAQIRSFKDNIVFMGKVDDLHYRVEHMDDGWFNFFDNALIHLALVEPPIHWSQLLDKEFFYECEKAFGAMRLGTSSKHYASNTLFTQQYNLWLKEQFSEGKHLWSGNYEFDRDRTAKLLSSYTLLATHYPPSAGEKTPEAEFLRLTDMRRAIHKSATRDLSSADASTLAPLNFMLQLDQTVKPGILKAMNSIDTFRCRQANALIESTHTSASYVTSTNPSLSVPREVTITEYLRTASLVMMQIQPILLNAMAFGLRVPLDSSKKDSKKERGQGKESGNKHDKPDLSEPNKGSSRLDKSRKDSKKEAPSTETHRENPKKKRERSESKSPRAKDTGRDGSKTTSREKPPSTNKDSKPDWCYRCGHVHTGKSCNLRDHPDANHDSDTPWIKSKYGVLWRAKGENNLPHNRSLAKPKWKGAKGDEKPAGQKRKETSKPPERESKRRKEERETSSVDFRYTKSSKTSKGGKGERPVTPRRDKRDSEEEEGELSDSDCKSSSTLASLNTLSETLTLQDFLITCSIYSSPSRILDRNVAALLDTGAIDRSYVSVDIGKALERAGSFVTPCDVDKICSCSSNICFKCSGKVSLHLKFFNELTNSYEMIFLTATIVESDFDVIVGRPDIGRYDLIKNVINSCSQTY